MLVKAGYAYAETWAMETEDDCDDQRLFAG